MTFTNLKIEIEEVKKLFENLSDYEACQIVLQTERNNAIDDISLDLSDINENINAISNTLFYHL